MLYWSTTHQKLSEGLEVYAFRLLRLPGRILGPAHFGEKMMCLGS